MINVIGLGYIGLPTALIFASKGHQVVGTDYNQNLIDNLRQGSIAFEENGLDLLLEEANQNEILFTTEYIASDIYIVAVPTPYDEDNKKIDSSFVVNAVKEIIKVCHQNAIVVIESTISPGTIDNVIKPIIKESKFLLGENFHLAHAPERIIPGNMIYELMNNSRTIGVDSVDIGTILSNLYSSITNGKVVVTDIITAEMTKVIENTFRAVNIAFANELAKLCRKANMNVYEIIKIANMHPRVNILNPGPGVGGHCIPVDPWFLVGDYPFLTELIQQALKINQSMPAFVLERAHQIMNENNINDVSRVGLYGLTYKENVDDYRESPTLQLLDLQAKYLAGNLKVYDPLVKKNIVENQYHDLTEFLESIDMVILMVKHNEIILNLDKLSGKIVFDTQNISKLNNAYKL